MVSGGQPEKEYLGRRFSQASFQPGSFPHDFLRNHAGPLDTEDVRNQTVLDLIQYCRERTIPVSVVEHPEVTISCLEKAALFDKHSEYEFYGELLVARGSLLTWKVGDENKFIVVMSDGDSRIDFKEVKRFLNLPKRVDLKMYSGEVEPILALEKGGISALIEDPSRVHSIYFDQSLVVKGIYNPDSRWDFAFSSRHSVLISANALLEFLGQHHRFDSKVHRYEPPFPQFTES